MDNTSLNFQEILNAFSHGIALFDDELVCIYANSAGAKFFSDTISDSLLGKKINQFFAEKEYHLFQNEISTTLQTKGFWEGRLEEFGSKKLYLDTEFALLSNKSILVVFQEIKKELDIEASCLETEEKYKILTDYLPGVLYLCENDERYTMHYLSDAVEKLTGYPKKDFLKDKISFVELYHPEDKIWIPGRVDKALNEQQPFHLVYRIKHKEGHWLWIDERGVGIYKEDKLFLIEGYIMDVTPQMEANRTLQENQERLKEIIESQRDIIFEIDHTCEFTFVSPSCEELLGFSPEDFIGKSFGSFLVQEEQRTTTSRINAFFDKRKEDYSFTNEWRHASDGSRWMRTNMRLIFDKEKNLRGARGSIRDITKIRNLQQQLRQTQKMEAVGVLAGGIAHDFNNLLTAILSHIDLIRMNMSSSPPVLNSAKVIEEAAEQARKLTQQLLGFAQKGKNQNIPTDLHDIITKVCQLLKQTVINKSIFINIDLDAREYHMMGDPSQLQQVFFELGTNALDAMEMSSSGTFSIETRNTFVNPQKNQGGFKLAAGEYISITIKDNGVGIKEEDQARIFDPFFTTKYTINSSGMGLAMAYGIVTTHCGEIHLRESKTGEGSTFELIFPVCHKPRELGEGDTRRLIIGAKGSILLIDDQDVVLNAGKALLEKLGYRVYAAEGGHEGVVLFSERLKEIDLVLLDMSMPEMDGEACFKRLKTLNPKVKVILTTGYSLNERAQKLLDQGIQGFLEKPFRLGRLSEAITAVLSGKNSY